MSKRIRSWPSPQPLPSLPLVPPRAPRGCPGPKRSTCRTSSVLEPSQRRTRVAAGRGRRARRPGSDFVYETAPARFSVMVSLKPGKDGAQPEVGAMSRRTRTRCRPDAQAMPTGIDRSRRGRRQPRHRGIDDHRVRRRRGRDRHGRSTSSDPDSTCRPESTASVGTGPGSSKTYTCTTGGDDYHYHGTTSPERSAARTTAVASSACARRRLWPVRSSTPPGPAPVPRSLRVSTGCSVTHRFEVAITSLGGSASAS